MNKNEFINKINSIISINKLKNEKIIEFHKNNKFIEKKNYYVFKLYFNYTVSLFIKNNIILSIDMSLTNDKYIDMINYSDETDFCNCNIINLMNKYKSNKCMFNDFTNIYIYVDYDYIYNVIKHLYTLYLTLNENSHEL